MKIPIKLGDTEINYVLCLTSAPQSYDGFGTFALQDYDRHPMEKDVRTPHRVVLVREEHLQWQMDRNGSGMHRTEEIDWITQAQLRDLLYERMIGKDLVPKTQVENAARTTASLVQFAHQMNADLAYLGLGYPEGSESPIGRAVAQVADVLGDGAARKLHSAGALTPGGERMAQIDMAARAHVRPTNVLSTALAEFTSQLRTEAKEIEADGPHSPLASLDVARRAAKVLVLRDVAERIEVLTEKTRTVAPTTASWKQHFPDVESVPALVEQYGETLVQFAEEQERRTGIASGNTLLVTVRDNGFELTSEKVSYSIPFGSVRAGMPISTSSSLTHPLQVGVDKSVKVLADALQTALGVMRNVQASESDNLSPQLAEDLVRVISTTLDQCGHSLPVEHEDSLKQAISTFTPGIVVMPAPEIQAAESALIEAGFPDLAAETLPEADRQQDVVAAPRKPRRS